MMLLTFLDGITAPLIYCIINKTFRREIIETKAAGHISLFFMVWRGTYDAAKVKAHETIKYFAYL